MLKLFMTAFGSHLIYTINDDLKFSPKQRDIKGLGKLIDQDITTILSRIHTRPRSEESSSAALKNIVYNYENIRTFKSIIHLSHHIEDFKVLRQIQIQDLMNRAYPNDSELYHVMKYVYNKSTKINRDNWILDLKSVREGFIRIFNDINYDPMLGDVEKFVSQLMARMFLFDPEGALTKDSNYHYDYVTRRLIRIHLLLHHEHSAWLHMYLRDNIMFTGLKDIIK